MFNDEFFNVSVINERMKQFRIELKRIVKNFAGHFHSQFMVIQNANDPFSMKKRK